MSLSREDVILGRALMAWGLVDRSALLSCAEDVRRWAAHGHAVSLGQVLVQRRLLTPVYYQAILARLHQHYLNSSQVSPHVQQATQNLPGMTDSGRYTKRVQRPDMDASAIDRAVESWDSVAEGVNAEGSQLGFEIDLGEEAVKPKRRERRPDFAIRKKLGVGQDSDQFPIGAWVVQEYLAAGNFGLVYRVFHHTSQTPFALKLLKQPDPSEEVKQRFVREARTMFNLQHRAIVKVHDAGVTQGLLWFVMDFMPGKDLKQILADQGKLDLQAGLGVMETICDAVAYAHSRGIFHRDLKPENVIMRRGIEPVLTDFGLAKDSGSTLNLTREGQRIGTPLYMAPELLMDAEGATEQSEVYSLGAMLYEVLTGEVPYFAKSLFDLADLIDAGKHKPLRKLCPEAPRKLEKLVKRALSKDPSKRPRDAGEMRDELKTM